MTCSIIIPVFGTERLLRSCLIALKRNTPPHELVLVDNATGYALPDHAVTVRNGANQGFAIACNEGARMASGDTLVLLNVDTEPRPGWLEPLIAALQEPGVGIAGAKLLYPNSQVQHAGVDLYMSRGILTAAHSPVSMADVRRFVPAVTGACLAIRREVWDQVGGLDEGYWCGYEDVDLCLTAGALGWSVLYEPASVVMHHESASGPARWTHVSANVQRLQDKWAGKVSA